MKTINNNNQRDKISKGRLVRALPMGRWFTFEAVELDIIKSSFDRRIKAMPRHLIEWRTAGKSNQFRIKEGCLTALLAAYSITPKAKPEKQARPIAQLSAVSIKELSLHNLFMNA